MTLVIAIQHYIKVVAIGLLMVLQMLRIASNKQIFCTIQ